MIIKSLEQLNSLSKKIGDKLEESDCIFNWRNWVGKTTFTRFLINNLQKEGTKTTDVVSPTFNLLYSMT